MQTLELIRLEASQIPEIMLPMGTDDSYTEKGYAVKLTKLGEVWLVFDVDYFEQWFHFVDRDAGPTSQLVDSTCSVDNVRMEDDACNTIPLANASEIEELLSKTIKGNKE